MSNIEEPKMIEFTCEVCNRKFRMPKPAFHTKYELVSFEEDARMCPECAQLPPKTIAQKVQKKWNPTVWDPKKHDVAYME